MLDSLRKMGAGGKLRRFVGPPLHPVLVKYYGSPEAVGVCLSGGEIPNTTGKGVFENSLVNSRMSGCARFGQEGNPLLATSKPLVFASQISKDARSG